MQLNEVDIDVKNPGLLEVPPGKEVNELPQSHFQNLIDRKGYEKVIRGLTNLEVWNKNKNPKLSQWASDMADKLRAANKKDESCSVRLLSRVDEINAKTFAKFGTKVWNAGKSVGKSLYHGGKEALKRAGVTAQNAIVAGASAPIGANIALKYNDPNRSKKKNKEHRYSTSDVAAISTALRKDESLKSEAFSIAANKLESILEFAKKRKTNQSRTNKGNPNGKTNRSHYTKSYKAPEQKALDRLGKGFQNPNKESVDPKVVERQAAINAKRKQTLENNKIKAAKEAEEASKKRMLDYAQKEQPVNINLKNRISDAEVKRMEQLVKRDRVFNKVLKRAKFKGGLIGAGITAGVGAAGYGIHKWVNRNKNKNTDRGKY